MANSSPELPWRQDGDALLLQLFVQPRASRNEVCGIHESELKVKLTSPPVEGAANDACRQFFSKLLKVPKSSITIVSGETSRHKRIRVENYTVEKAESLFSIVR